MGKSVKLTKTPYTQGEIKVILGSLLSIPAEDIEKFIVIVTGPCADCGGNDRYTTIDNTRTAAEYVGMTDEAVEVRIEKETRLS